MKTEEQKLVLIRSQGGICVWGVYVHEILVLRGMCPEGKCQESV